jgi:hypothetical protein
MAWGWSHTIEAYQNARDQLDVLPIDTLRVIWAEWHAHTSREEDPGAFNEKRYRKARRRAETIYMRLGADFQQERLAEYVWECMEQLATCDNGGWNAWACPYGCHTVPFDPPAKESHNEKAR